MTALVLQARLDSSRLPNKSLFPFFGKPMIFRVMEALSFLAVDTRILACPEDSYSAFAALAEEAGFALVTGPKEDVLSRYCIAIRQTGAGRIIRATGDNPFVFVDAALALNQEAEALGTDYAAYNGLPHGAGVESVLSEALLRAEREAKGEAEREHVCPYIYNNPELFRIHRPPSPGLWHAPGIRITVDTREDYEFSLLLYEQLLSLPVEERCKGKNIIERFKSLQGKIQ